MEQLPSQQTGSETDFVKEKKYDSLDEAHKGFQKASGRMLSVNNWRNYTGAGSARFQLCNNEGVDLDVMPEEGFLISIDMPVPGPDAGDGLEWVIIERLVSGGDAHSAEEYVMMTVRPIPDPRKTNDTVAHFYKDASTSTFVVRRNGRLVTAGAHGRNETPNDEQVDLHDKIRNTAIALLARIGLSGGQWQRLV